MLDIKINKKSVQVSKEYWKYCEMEEIWKNREEKTKN
jgi:hypothetical protein